MVEKSLGAWIDLLRQEIHKENRHDEYEQQQKNRKLIE